MKIIVTGIAGFIGTALALRAAGHPQLEIIGVDNLSRRGAAENLEVLRCLGHQLTFYRGDIRDVAFVDTVFREHADAAAVVHLAAQTAVTSSVIAPRHDFEVNATGTFNLLEAVRANASDATFVYASTNKVYGGIDHEGVEQIGDRYRYVALPRGVDESCPLDFHSPYGCSKGAADQYVRDYARIYGLRTVVFRQSCIYGPRQYGFEEQGWVAWFTIASVLGAPITIYGDGYQTRDLLWVDDLCDLYFRAIEQSDRVAGKVYNVGGGPATARSVREVLGELERTGGRAISPQRGDWRPGDQRVFVANIERVRRDLAWSPAVGPEEGIARLLQWVDSNAHAIGEVVLASASSDMLL